MGTMLDSGNNTFIQPIVLNTNGGIKRRKECIMSLQIFHELFLPTPFVHLQHKYDAIVFSDVVK